MTTCRVEAMVVVLIDAIDTVKRKVKSVLLVLCKIPIG